MNLGEVRALCRLTLADATKWPDASLDHWIRAAIRLYSAHFPRPWRGEIELVTGTQAYSVPGGLDVSAVLSVEYPAGESPPRFLRCVPEASALFAAAGQAYALRGVDEDSTAAEVGRIVFAETVATGETAIVEYLGPHALPAVGTDADVITVPAQHSEAITAFVAFAALYELDMDEAVAVDDSSIVLSQLGQEARRAWLRYKEVMDRLVWLPTAALQPASGQPAWGDIGL